MKKVRIVGDFGSVIGMFKSNKHRGWAPMLNDIHDTPDLVCFCGGTDIEPRLYDENPLEGVSWDTYRDNKEIEIFRRYKDIPKVGICRGGQLLNVLSGGALWQDVNNHEQSHVVINLLPMKRRAMGLEMILTSSHHQMMIPGDQGEVLAFAMNQKHTSGLATEYNSYKRREIPRFDTEVVWYEHTQSLCFQPHPEWSMSKGGKITEAYFFELLEHFFK